jgi:phosphoketolase
LKGLTYLRTHHYNLHVRGSKEEGTTTTPFDMAVLNDLGRSGAFMPRGTFLDDPDRQALGLANQCIAHMGRQERKLSKPNNNPQPSARTSTIGGVKTSKETRRYYVHMLSTNTRQASVV